MFGLYVVLIVSGVVAYLLVGLTSG